MSVSGCKGSTLVPALGCGAIGAIAFLSRKIVPQWASKPLLLTATVITPGGCYASIVSYLTPADPLKNSGKKLAGLANPKNPVPYDKLMTAELDLSHLGGSGKVMEFWFEFKNNHRTLVKVQEELKVSQLLGALQGVRLISGGEVLGLDNHTPIKDVKMVVVFRDCKSLGRIFIFKD